MKRRDCITLLGGIALGLPLPVLAQPVSRRVIGYLSARSPEDTAHLLAAVHRGLSEGGFVEGKNLAVEYRWARGQYDRLPALAAELARLPLAVLVATGGEPAALAAKAATSSIPIVFTVGSDPVALGLVASYNRPGGNVTGVNMLSTTLEAKRIGILHEMLPRATTLAYLVNPKNPPSESQLVDAQQAARRLGLRIHVLRADTDGEIELAFDAVRRERIQMLAVASAPFFDTRREKLVALAARDAVPTMYYFREYVMAGGLTSYGLDLVAAYRQAGIYAGQILNGAKPADLPVIQPTKFELVLNLKTAKKLRLDVPRDLLARVDEVIE